jgi:hypothetical protein
MKLEASLPFFFVSNSRLVYFAFMGTDVGVQKAGQWGIVSGQTLSDNGGFTTQ